MARVRKFGTDVVDQLSETDARQQGKKGGAGLDDRSVMGFLEFLDRIHEPRRCQVDILIYRCHNIFMTDTVLGVAEAKKRFSEIVDRVARGERFVVCRRGKPAVALVAPSDISGHSRQGPPRGLAAFAGALSEWDELEDVVEEIYAARSRSKDRAVPDLRD